MKTKRYTTGIIAIAIILCSMQRVSAQTLQVSSTEKFIAYSLYNFSKLVEWPTSATATVFKIAIVGDSKVYDELSRLSTNKKVANARYEITYCRKPEELQGYYNIIYLSNMQSGKVTDFVAQAEERSILLVTERQGMTKYGSTICFMVKDNGMMSFEIAKDNANRNNLAIRTQLEKMAGRIM